MPLGGPTHVNAKQSWSFLSSLNPQIVKPSQETMILGSTFEAQNMSAPTIKGGQRHPLK